MTSHPKHNKEPFVRLSRRMTVSPGFSWVVRIIAFLLSILVCCLVSCAMSPRVNFGFFFSKLFVGAFGTADMVKAMLRDAAVLLMLALAVTPCFKMRYWNIGGEGQAMMGAFGCTLVVAYGADKMPVGGVIVLSFVTAVAFATIWAVVPALLKAKWNTNETLLTLMFNYIAVCLGAFLIKKVEPKGTGSLSLATGTVASLGADAFWIVLVTALVMMGLMFVYMSYSKHGYEIAVVGESPNTARYVGINNKMVVIRTLVLCGVLCGIVGWLLVSVKDGSFSSANMAQSTVGGRGFTAVLVSWLAQFNPFAMALTAFLVSFITRGATNVANNAYLGNNYAGMLVGIFFFFIIATEFFINFKMVFRSREELAREPDDLPPLVLCDEADAADAAPASDADTTQNPPADATDDGAQA